ncbi:hypothetical protein TU94_22210 [Streptomyces cyaneogriseus subsp. noncyanogenus]|uniref:Uncharacterized protein n=2 Tax=Streptomyces cyaneogriseus TaxID=68192 RepID=A0A0C5FUQ5_9ACTN|nr:hypothetical protein TU94_22210 [Streptomyces cyaneogriseus subsp. noncyanogenus]
MMFLELLQAFGTFLGGLGALIAGTAQLLALFQKKGEEREAGHGGDESRVRMIPPGLVACPAAAA